MTGDHLGSAGDHHLVDVAADQHLAMALSGWQLLRDRGSLRSMTTSPNPYRGFRFPPGSAPGPQTPASGRAVRPEEPR